jgi:hypothetical protein
MLYATPIGLFPNLDMKKYAILVPSPVLMTVLAMKNANTTSHTTLSLNPLRAVFIGIAEVTIQPTKASKVITPIGSGFKINPTIVEMNMTKVCHAFVVSSAGCSQFQRKTDTNKIVKMLIFLLFIICLDIFNYYEKQYIGSSIYYCE